MINEQKERNTLTKMSDLEYSKNDVEMMRYRPCKLAYSLGLGGMFLSLLACFVGLNSMAGGTVNTIIVIMVNIVVLLGGFLACEKAKSYSQTGNIALLVFGGISVARIFYVPIIIMTNFATFASFIGADGKIRQDLTAEELETLKGAQANLGPTVTAHYSDATAANAFLPASGYFRGIAAIVLLAISAAMFIAGGVIGYLQSKKLNTYLDSLKEAK